VSIISYDEAPSPLSDRERHQLQRMFSDYMEVPGEWKTSLRKDLEADPPVLGKMALGNAVGPPGPTGPQGPQGPPGESNAAYTGTWNWQNGGDASASGRVSTDQPNAWFSSTEFRLNEQTAPGVDVTSYFSRFKAGDQVRVQVRDDANTYVKLTLTAVGTDHGTWWSWPVTFVVGQGSPPSNNTPMSITFLVTGSLGSQWTNNVRDFGASGNGTTDDTSAIQAAINAAVNAGGGTVFFPPGVYSSGRLTVDGNGITLVGSGVTSVLKAKSGITTTDLIRVNTTGDLAGLTRLHDFELRDLKLDGSNVNVANAGLMSLVAIYCVDHVRVSNVYVYNAYGSCLDLCGCSNTWVGGGTVIDTLRPGTPQGNGVNIYDAANFTQGQIWGEHTVEGVHVYNVPTVCILVAGAGGGRISVTGCVCRGTPNDTSFGIMCEVGGIDTTDVIIASNYVDQKQNGIGMTNSASAVVPYGSRYSVVGNVVRNCFYAVVVNERLGTVVGNVITDANVGIIAGADRDLEESDFVISDNVISLRPGATGQGIALSKSGTGSKLLRRLVVSGNTINGDVQPGIVKPYLVADSTAGQVTAGTHVYGVSFVTSAGESLPSPISDVVTVDASHTKVSVTCIPIGPDGVTARKLYRSSAGATALKLLATVSDNTSRTYTDTTPDASLGAAPPTRGASSSADGIWVRGRVRDVEIRGNEVTGMGLNGVHLEGSPTEIRIDGNRIVDNGYRADVANQNGIRVEAGTQVQITGNRIYDSGLGTQTQTVSVAGGVTGYAQARGGYTLTDAATVTPDALKGDTAHWTIAANAARTVAAPVGIGATAGARFTLMVKNGIGGGTAFTAANLTFNAIYLRAGAFPSANIADTKIRSISFEYNGTNWVEIGRVDADL